MKAPDRLFINGQWRSSENGAEQAILNPATEEVVGSVPMATARDLDDALQGSAAAFKAWRETDAWTRSRALRRVADWIRDNAGAMAPFLTEEQGKPLPEAKGEILAAGEQFEWYAEEARRVYGRTIDGHSRGHRLMVIRQPIGPVAAFSPWNFPSLLTARKIAPALAAGCSIIVKPPIEAPRTALFLAKACEEAGLPAGLVNMVTGSSGMISSHLIRSPIIRKVTITGSVPVGRQLMTQCAEELKPITLELGGHSPVLVFEDADLEQAATLCARAKFRNNGQVCICASRFYIQERVKERFLEIFTEVTRSLTIGDGRSPGVDVGPLANRKRLEAAEHLVEDALAKGARLVSGGRRPEGFTRGYFFEPTILADMTPDMEIMSEEPFCPIAPIDTFTDLEDGLAKANSTEFGLAGYIFTTSTRTAFLASEGLDVGMVGVNNLVIATAEAPFGGIRKSGFGREGGIEWAEAYTVPKYINILL